MFIIIPGEIIAMVTFPGVVLHEIAHRFFCDLFNVPVYEVRYYNLLNTEAGHVIRKRTENVYHSFFIAIAPFIINSLVCMVLTSIKGIVIFHGTDFTTSSWTISNTLLGIITFIGYGVGYNAIPSDQDVKELPDLAKSKIGWVGLGFFKDMIMLLNVRFIGLIFRIFYVYGLSLLLPYYFLS